MIAVVDYGMGNLRSVQKALESVGGEAVVTDKPEVITEARAIVLPGVGAFGAAVEKLQAQNLIGLLKREISSGKPFLGICLGLQLLFQESEESPGVAGLGLLEGKVKALKVSLKIPHMGWNQVHLNPKNKSRLFQGIHDKTFFYFDHTFAVVPKDPRDIATTTDYEVDFVSAVKRDNIYGVQFHPEKSQAAGLRLLRNFVMFSKVPLGAFKLIKEITRRTRKR